MNTPEAQLANLRERVEKVIQSIEAHPLYNSAIADAVRGGDHDLECEIGGGEATVSCWAGELQAALKGQP